MTMYFTDQTLSVTCVTDHGQEFSKYVSDKKNPVERPC